MEGPPDQRRWKTVLPGSRGFDAVVLQNDPREAGGVNGKANGRSISPASPIRAVLHIYGRFSEKSRTEKKAFLASLIGFPIVVGILSGALFLVTTAGYDSRGVERVEDVELDGRTHEVYEFRMPGRFENDFPVDSTKSSGFLYCRILQTPST